MNVPDELPGDVPDDIVVRLRAICRGLPEVDEEPAWVGLRWRVRGRTIAHVRPAAYEYPPEYADAVATGELVTAITFKSRGPELHALLHTGAPFFPVDWSPEVVGMILDEQTDWAEVAELLTDSYLILAPKKLAVLVDPTTPP